MITGRLSPAADMAVPLPAPLALLGSSTVSTKGPIKRVSGMVRRSRNIFLASGAGRGDAAV